MRAMTSWSSSVCEVRRKLQAERASGGPLAINTEGDIYRLNQLPISLHIGKSLPLGVSSLEAEQIEVVVITYQSIFGDWVKGIDKILPDSFSTNAPIHNFRLIRYDHLSLRRRYNRSFPRPPFSTHDCPVQRFTQKNTPDPRPDFLLLFQSLCVA
jgi:hypothetical protein